MCDSGHHSRLRHLRSPLVTSGHLDSFTPYHEITLKNALWVTVVTLVTSFLGGGGVVKLFMCDPEHHRHRRHLWLPSVTSGHLDTFTTCNEITLKIALWVTVVTLVISF